MEKPKRRFRASDVHILLVVLMLLSILMVGQQLSKDVYQFGLVLLISSTLVQVAFGNIPGHFGLSRAMRFFIPFMGIVLLVFFLGYVLVPFLYALGR